MKTKICISSILTTFLLSGCSFTSDSAFNKDINQLKDKNNKKIMLDGKNMPDIMNGVEHELSKPQFFQITSPMNLSSILTEIGKIEDREYYLQKEQKDLTIPPSAIKLKSFSDLQLYIEDTLEQNIFIAKNAAIKERLKIVKVRDIGAKKLDLNKIKFTLNGQISAVRAFKLLEEVPEFDFSINIKFEDFEYKGGSTDMGASASSSTQNQLFDDTAILFNGNTVGNFFEFLRNKLNIFIDVDYEKKIVNVYKYKQEFVQLTTGNIQIKGSVSGNNSSPVAGGGTESSSSAENNAVEKTFDIDIMKRVKELLEIEINNSKNRGNTKVYANVMEQSGTVVVYADNETLSNIQKQINRFNSDYNDSIEIEFFAFDLILDKQYVFESGLTRNLDRTNNSGALTNQTLNLNSVISNTIASVSKKTDDGLNYSVLLNSLDKYGMVANQRQKKWVLRNHIPKSDTGVTTRRYLKDIRVVDPTVDGGTTSTQTETDTILEPQNFNVVAHYSNGNVSVDLTTSLGKLISMENLPAGDTILNSPKTESQSQTLNMQIKDGDSYVATVSKEIKSAKEYTGVLPTDILLTKLVGGGIDDGFIYKNSFVIVTARKIKN